MFEIIEHALGLCNDHHSHINFLDFRQEFIDVFKNIRQSYNIYKYGNS